MTERALALALVPAWLTCAGGFAVGAAVLYPLAWLGGAR